MILLCILVVVAFGAKPKDPKQDLDSREPPSFAVIVQVVAVVVVVLLIVLFWWMVLIMVITGGVVAFFVFFVFFVAIVHGHARPPVDKDLTKVDSVNPVAAADAPAPMQRSHEGFPEQNNQHEQIDAKARVSEHKDEV